jgi:hypothetical protein
VSVAVPESASPDEASRPPRLLFVPVSSPRGVGEYVRSLTIARAARARWPDVEIAFVVSSEAPYARDVPFVTHETPTSPTHHVTEVNEILTRFHPDVVIFDASGRVAQLAHAKRLGCVTVFVSQHRRKRGRGFRWRRMRLLDMHWIAQPSFVDGELGVLERMKLRLLGHPVVRFIGPVFPAPSPPAIELPGKPYFFCCSGGGGNAVGGRNGAELFLEAAERISGESGLPGVVVMGPNYRGTAGGASGLLVLPQLKPAELAHVLAGALFALVGGGSLLGQAVALGVPSAAAPVARDQPDRIAAYARAGLCLAADPRLLALTVLEQLDEPCRERLRVRLQYAGVRNGLDEAIEQLAPIMARARSGAAAGAEP